ncbi:uncharacterized protein B0H18DRAFT_963624 [Fomitopsis serialis]|uniref:uncharacterized protein n=1 Tax=Fomitopsis serialis TaxID=139415 RepID=UPI0020082ED8|nr:uncharacterized protein B0H18DRAFT_963624 [Neoantrodia serialis]KAH9910227.1 hypothetical protein B0H18DRAFT_963624 [Neoantrodia serialis]
MITHGQGGEADEDVDCGDAGIDGVAHALEDGARTPDGVHENGKTRVCEDDAGIAAGNGRRVVNSVTGRSNQGGEPLAMLDDAAFALGKTAGKAQAWTTASSCDVVAETPRRRRVSFALASWSRVAMLTPRAMLLMRLIEEQERGREAPQWGYEPSRGASQEGAAQVVPSWAGGLRGRPNWCLPLATCEETGVQTADASPGPIPNAYINASLQGPFSREHLRTGDGRKRPSYVGAGDSNVSVLMAGHSLPWRAANAVTRHSRSMRLATSQRRMCHRNEDTEMVNNSVLHLHTGSGNG